MAPHIEKNTKYRKSSKISWAAQHPAARGLTAAKKHPTQFRQNLSALFTMLATNQITPIIAAKLPLQQVPQAHHLLETSSTRGKLVLTF
jgi:NADPH:quinone reductase-like Zn-dependent oxidoreductase